MQLLRSDLDMVSIFSHGTLFEFAVRDEFCPSFDRLVTLPSNYNVHQLKLYLQQTLSRELSELTKTQQHVSLRQIQIYWRPLNTTPDF